MTGTVLRNARYTIRSFVAWGVISDSEKKGCYDAAGKFILEDPKTISLLFESILVQKPNSQFTLSSIVNSPALFPFEIPYLNAGTIIKINPRIKSMRYGGNDEYIFV